MIRAEALEKAFGKNRAVKGISFSVCEGEIFGIVGPDGAGKTTTLRMLAGVTEPTGGDISFPDWDKGKSSPGELIGYMPQNFSLYEEFSVAENMNFLGSMFGLGRDEIKSEGDRILSMVGLLDFKERPAGKLSGGMKQKLSLACALLHQPELLILDEPSTGVDPVSRRAFWEILYKLNAGGMTIVVSTPYMDEAELCSRLAFLHHGEIIAAGSPEEICSRYPWRIVEVGPIDKWSRKFFGKLTCHDMNFFGDTVHIAGSDPQAMIRSAEAALSESGIDGGSAREISPSLEDVFIELSKD